MVNTFVEFKKESEIVWRVAHTRYIYNYMGTEGQTEIWTYRHTEGRNTENYVPALFLCICQGLWPSYTTPKTMSLRFSKKRWRTKINIWQFFFSSYTCMSRPVTELRNTENYVPPLFSEKAGDKNKCMMYSLFYFLLICQGLWLSSVGFLLIRRRKSTIFGTD